jgi:hypothetical protein
MQSHCTKNKGKHHSPAQQKIRNEIREHGGTIYERKRTNQTLFYLLISLDGDNIWTSDEVHYIFISVYLSHLKQSWHQIREDGKDAFPKSDLWCDVYIFVSKGNATIDYLLL